MKSHTTFGLTLGIVFMPMRAVPDDWKDRLAELCIPSDFAMWRWLHQTGECHALLLFEGAELVPRAIIGWACATFEDGPNGVLGVFIDPTRRGLGYASRLVDALVKFVHPLAESGTLQAVSKRFPRYREIVESAGLEFREWQ